MSDDRGRVFKSSLTDNTLRTIHRAFVWGKSIYAIERLSDYHQPPSMVKFQLGTDGKGTGYTQLGDIAANRCRGVLATCVYRGMAYLFFDRQSDTDGGTYQIRFKVTSNPDEGWLPADGEGYDTTLSAHYGDRGVPSLEAIELGGLLHLFHHRNNNIECAVFDGKSWRSLGTFMSNYLPQFAMCSAMRGGKPIVVIAGRHRNRPDMIALHSTTSDLKVTDPYFHHPDWVQIDDPFALVQGSVANDKEANVVQLFGNNSGAFSSQLRRLTVNLDGLTPAGEWADSTLNNKPQGTRHFAVVAASLPVAGKADFRRELAVLTSYHDSTFRSQHLGVYPSDYFRCENAGAKPIDTGDEATEEPGAWTLIGVIEGAPPFTRNGVTPKEQTSVVYYGQVTTHKIVIAETFETSVSAGATLGNETFNVSAELAVTFGSAVALSTSVFSEVEQTMSNVIHNADGEYGWRIVSKPRLTGRRFTQLSYGEMVTIATYYVVLVSGASVVASRYLLADPPAGMTRRNRSDDLLFWKAVTFPAYDLIECHPMNTLSVSVGGNESSVRLGLTTGKDRTTSGMATATISRKTSLAALFGVEGSAAFSYGQSRTVTSEFTEYIKAALKLVAPSNADHADLVTELDVSPSWFIAKKDLRLDPTNRPFWVPDESRYNGIVPWCLSWKVTRLKKGTEEENPAVAAGLEPATTD